MDPAGDDQIVEDFPPFFRRYASGRVVRHDHRAAVPASFDPATGVDSKDVVIDPATGVSARLYLPSVGSDHGKLPILVYYHGGGFCIESAFSPLYHPYLNSLAATAGMVVVSVEYRLAPEHLLPAAYDDSWAALTWVFSSAADSWLTDSGDRTRVFVAGDSAGANISHHMAMRVAASDDEVVKLAGMVLFHPYFWGSDAEDPATQWIGRLWRVVNEAGVELDHPWINPTAEGMERYRCRLVMVAVAEADVLAERGKLFCERLKGSGWGGKVELVVSPGLDHVFHLREPECSEAVELMEKVVAFFKDRS